MNIVCLGQSDWEHAYVSRQLFRRLAARGHRVLFVDPVTFGSRDNLRQVAPGLHVLTLRSRDTRTNLISKRLHGRLTRRRLAQVAETLGLWAPAVVCGWPASRWLVDAVDPSCVVFFAEDDNSAFSGLNEAFVAEQRREEARLVAESDVVLAVSPTLVERFKKDQPRTYLQENGVEADDFAPAALRRAETTATLRDLAGPVVGFVGLIDDRMDQVLVARVAAAVATRGGSVALVGRVKDGIDVSALRAIDNVVFAGYLDYDDLPGAYAAIDVGIVPYVRSPLTESCNPLKVYEYLAAGLPTIATDLPGFNSARAAIAVTTSHDAFAKAVLRAIADPAAGAAQRHRVAEAASWQRRADLFERRLREANEVAAAKRRAAGLPEPRIDRSGRVAASIEPRLDGKDQSVRAVSNNYEALALSGQQKVVYAATRILGHAYYLVRRATRLLKGDSRKIARILVVRNGHLGDTVVFFPTLRALKARFPTAKIVVGVAPGSSGGSLLESSPYVDEIVELHFFNKSRAARWRGAMRLLRRGFDLVVTGVWYFNLPEAVFSGAPLRVGLNDGHPLQAYADRVVPIDPNLHEAELNLRLVDAAFGPVPQGDRVPRLDLDEAAVAAAGQRFRDRIGINVDDEVVAMHPGSKRPSRRWPADKFAGLATALLQERPNLKIVFTAAGRGEDELVGRILAGIPDDVRGRAINAFEAGGLLGLVGFYDKCKALICNDTGVMHVARARGVPVVAVIGPENDRRWGPYPLGDSPAVVVRQEVPGTPHNKDVCDWNLSLAGIGVDRVARHVRRVLDGTVEVEPRQVGGRTLWPVVRDVERASFETLAERGLRVPRVAVVVPRSAALLGLPGDDGAADDRTLVETAQAIGRSRYPALDLRLVVDDRLVGGELCDLGEVVVAEPSIGDNNAADAAWSRLLASTDAGLFVLVRPGRLVPPTLIAGLVSAYLRGPNADAASVDGPVPNADAVAAWCAGDLGDGAIVVTRDLLRGLLDHPIPRPPRIPPELPIVFRAAASL